MTEAFLPDDNLPELTARQRSVLAEREYAEGSISDLRARWHVYTYAEDRIDYYKTAYEKMQCSPDATILDVGCSDGTGLITKRLRDEYTGLLIGVDIDPKIFEYGKAANSGIKAADMRPVSFVASRGERLPFADNSVDGAMAMFMIYHSSDPRRLLRELTRVTKAGSPIAISTSGPENKFMQRRFEQTIARELGARRPPIFTESFDTNVAETLLPKYFRVAEVVTQHCALVIPSPKIDGGTGYEKYLSSLRSMQKHFKPKPSDAEWEETVRKVVRPYMEKDFAEKGEFKDTVDRKLYICENTKAT